MLRRTTGKRAARTWPYSLQNPAEEGGGGGNWWDAASATILGAWQAKGVASYAASLLDLSGNGNDLAETNGAVSWSAGAGWSFAEADAKALNSGITITSAGDHPNFSLIARFANADTTTAGGRRTIAGCHRNSAFRSFLLSQWDAADNLAIGCGGIEHYFSDPSIASGVMAAAAGVGYVNAMSKGDITNGFSFSNTDVYMHIGGYYNNTGAITEYFTGDVIAVAMYAGQLTAGDVAAITTAMNTL